MAITLKRSSVIVATAIVGSFMTIDAHATLSLDEGIFGFRWGDAYETVERKPMSAKIVGGASSKHRLTLRGSLNFLGIATEFATLRFDEQNNTLMSASFGIDAAHRVELAKALAALGEPRIRSMPDGQVFSHLSEWTRSTLSLVVEFTTRGPSVDDPLVGEIRVRVSSGLGTAK